MRPGLLHAMNAPARRPWATVAVAGLVALLAAWGASRLRQDPSPLKSLFPPGQPAAAALIRVLEDFPTADEMLLLVTAPGDAPRPDRLTAFAERFAREVAGDEQASKLVTAVRYRADEQTREFFTRVVVPDGIFYLDDEEFAAARRRLTPPEMREQLDRDEAMLAAPGPAATALAKVLLQDPLRLREFLEKKLAAARPIRTYENSDAFLSEDGRSLLIRITGAGSPGDLGFCDRITAAVSAAAARVNTDGLSLQFTGAYPIAAQSQRSIRRDSIASVNGSVICLALLFALMFRRAPLLFAASFAPVALGVLCGFGAYALLGRGITPLTAVIGAVLAGIGIDWSIFYLVHYQERRGGGAPPVEAAGQTLGAIGGALVAAWVTSVTGFVAVTFTSVRVLRDFALVGSLGLAGTLVCTVFLLPALLVLLDRLRSRRAGSSSPRPAARFSLRPLLGWIDRHAGACVVVWGVAMAAAVAYLAVTGPRLALEPDPTVLHPRPNPPLDAEADIGRRMGTAPDSLIVHLSADNPQDLVALAHRVRDRLSLPAAREVGVTNTFGLATFLPDPAVASRRMAEVGPAMADRVVADFDAAVAGSSFSPSAYEKYRTFLRVLLTPTKAPGVADLLPYGQLAGTLLPRGALAGGPATESIMLVFLDRSMDAQADREALVGRLRGLLADLKGATPTGMSVLSLDTQETIHHDLPRLTAVAVAICAAYLLLHFRSLTQTLLAVLPTLCSVACVLTVARLAGAKMNLANIVAVPLLIGIDTDYGIFLVSAARRSRTRTELLDRAAASGRAVVLCAASALLGFGSLAFTSVPAIRSLGWAVAIGVSTCAAAALFLLLPLLLWMRGRGESDADRRGTEDRRLPAAAFKENTGTSMLTVAWVSLRRLAFLSPVGATECSPRRKPGDRRRATRFPLLFSPEGAAEHSFAPTGLGKKGRGGIAWPFPPGLRRGLHSVAPTGLRALAVALSVMVGGCAPTQRLSFPEHPLSRVGGVEWYDVRHNGLRQFGVGYDAAGRVDRLLYADGRHDAAADREYRLADYAGDRVPHLILLLDSIPYRTMAGRYEAGDFRWFDPPQKMIAPFPSMTQVCYSDVLHCPPLPGTSDQFFDPREGHKQNTQWQRLNGFELPYERRLTYRAGFIGQSLAYLDPDDWYGAELEDLRRAVEKAPDRVTIAYVGSASSMVCKHGRAGAERVLDGARQLCLQLLYERRGAIRISMMADHGHNYVRSKNFPLEQALKDAGFRPADRIRAPEDCVVDVNALVTYAGVHTPRPDDAAKALCRHEAIEVAIYQQGPRTILRTAGGAAAVECREGRLRYVPLDADVLGYGPVIERLKAEGKMDADGYADDEAWFRATLDHTWPNAPRRAWDAIHGRFINPPDLMLSLRDGWYAGNPSYENFIRMESTHGGLNQVNSATFVVTMTGRLKEAVRHEDVLGVLEPGFEPPVRR